MMIWKKYCYLISFPIAKKKKKKNANEKYFIKSTKSLKNWTISSHTSTN